MAKNTKVISKKSNRPNPKGSVRIETDSMGKVVVPSSVYWGAQTQRAVENFNISPLKEHPQFIIALAMVKKAAARVNNNNKSLDAKRSNTIVRAADEIIAAIKKSASKNTINSNAKNDLLENQFPIDVFQTGSGTSWNMNMNEVISNRANEILGSPRGAKKPVHPNDHVNKGQSSNDCIPTALYISLRVILPSLIAKAQTLGKTFRIKEKEFEKVIKLGRTHLQDAVPMTLGQEFGAFASQIEYAKDKLKQVLPDLETLPQGGSAVGTGLNTAPGFAKAFAQSITKQTNIPFKSTNNPFSRMAAAEPFVALAGALNVLSVALMKIANDLRLLSSGPRAALGEIILPSLQPGSSIMPGKVNPVIPEMVIQSVAQLMGKSETIKVAAQNGPLQLIMMFPILSYECLSAVELAARTCDVFAKKCISGILADKERAQYWIEYSLALVTPLAQKIGYDKAAALAHEAYHKKETIRKVVTRAKILSKTQIDRLLNPKNMV